MTLKEILLESRKENSTGLPFIRWEFQTGGLPIPFLGYPFIAVGHSKFDCSQGKDRNVAKKEQFMDQKVKNKNAGIYKKSRTLVRPTKKMGCPVSMCCKKVYIFPKCAISKDTKRNRTIMASKLKQQFCAILEKNARGEKIGGSSSEELGALVYLTKFADPLKHRYHLEFNEKSIINSENRNKLLYIGAFFEKLKNLEDAVDNYRREFNVRLYKVVKESFRSTNPLLKYEQLSYKCLHAQNNSDKKRYEPFLSFFLNDCIHYIIKGVFTRPQTVEGA